MQNLYTGRNVYLCALKRGINLAPVHAVDDDVRHQLCAARHKELINARSAGNIQIAVKILKIVDIGYHKMMLLIRNFITGIKSQNINIPIRQRPVRKTFISRLPGHQILLFRNPAKTLKIRFNVPGNVRTDSDNIVPFVTAPNCNFRHFKIPCC